MVHAGAAADETTCECDLSQQSLVCGADGITYQSRCLASCQGVVTAKDGPCNPSGAAMFAPADQTRPSRRSLSKARDAAAGTAATNVKMTGLDVMNK